MCEHTGREPRAEQATQRDVSESAKPLIGIYNTPVKKALLFPLLQMGNYFRCDFFHLFTTLISRRRKAE